MCGRRRRPLVSTRKTGWSPQNNLWTRGRRSKRSRLLKKDLEFASTRHHARHVMLPLGPNIFRAEAARSPKSEPDLSAPTTNCFFRPATGRFPPGPNYLRVGRGLIAEIRAGFVGVNNEFFPAPGGTLITTKAVGGA